MSEAFSPRTTNQTNVKELISQLTLRKNDTNQYDHDPAQIFVPGIDCQLTTIFNTSDARNEMRKLLEN